MVRVGAVFHVVFKSAPVGASTVVIASLLVLHCIITIISYYGHNAMGTRTRAAGLGGPRPPVRAPPPAGRPAAAMPRGGDMVSATASEDGCRATRRAGQECDGERARPASRR